MNKWTKEWVKKWKNKLIDEMALTVLAISWSWLDLPKHMFNTFINSAVSFFCVDFVSTSTDLSSDKCHNQINEPCYYINSKSIWCQL